MQVFLTVALSLLSIGTILLILSYGFGYNDAFIKSISMNQFSGKISAHGSGLFWKGIFNKISGEIRTDAPFYLTSSGIQTQEEFVKLKDAENLKNQVVEVGTNSQPMYAKWVLPIYIDEEKDSLIKIFSENPLASAMKVWAKVGMILCDELSKQEADYWTGNKEKAAQNIANKISVGRSTLEEETGFRIGEFELPDLTMGKKAQDASEKMYESAKMALAIAKMKTANPKMTMKAAANAVALANGLDVSKKIFEITDAEKILGGLGSLFNRKTT